MEKESTPTRAVPDSWYTGTLQELLAETGDSYRELDGGAIQVFTLDGRYCRLRDYRVTAAVSGPSFMLMPRR